MKKDNNKITVFLLCLVTLIVGVGIGVFISHSSKNVNLEENNSDQSTNVTNEKLNIRSDFVLDLYNKISFNNVDCFPIDSYLKKDKMLVSEFSNGTRLGIAYYSLGKYDVDDQNNNRMTLQEQDLKSAFSKVFGNNAEYSASDFDKMSCPFFQYDSKNKEYYSEGGCGNTCSFSERNQIIEATKYSDRIEVISALAYCGLTSNDGEEQTACYSDIDAKEKISNDNEADLINYKDSLKKIKYTFTYDNETGNYYYYSIEKIK